MSLNDKIEDLSKDLTSQKERMQTLQRLLTDLQTNYLKFMTNGIGLIARMESLSAELQTPCNELIKNGEALKKLQDKIKRKLQLEESTWEDLGTDIEKSNKCFIEYLEHYLTTVLKLADQVSPDLNPEGSNSSNPKKSLESSSQSSNQELSSQKTSLELSSTNGSLESSSSHSQQMFQANDPLVDREPFRVLNSKEQSLNEEIEMVKKLMEECTALTETIGAEKGRILQKVQSLSDKHGSSE